MPLSRRRRPLHSLPCTCRLLFPAEHGVSLDALSTALAAVEGMVVEPGGPGKVVARRGDWPIMVESGALPWVLQEVEPLLSAPAAGFSAEERAFLERCDCGIELACDPHHPGMSHITWGIVCQQVADLIGHYLRLDHGDLGN